jgi:hypothetical protein
MQTEMRLVGIELCPIAAALAPVALIPTARVDGRPIMSRAQLSRPRSNTWFHLPTAIRFVGTTKKH